MTSSATGGQGRGVVALIAGIPLTIILAASWLWYFVAQGDLDLIGAIGTANNGVLVKPPRQLREVDFTDDAGALFAWEDLEPRWTIVIPNAGSVCDSTCERRLYFTRQIHIALGRDFKRVQRVMLNDQPVSTIAVARPAELPEGWPADLTSNALVEFLTLGHPGLVALTASAQASGELFPEQSTDSGYWYLVDPAGWIMMRFDDSLDYKAVLSDLKFLLKNSGGA